MKLKALVVGIAIAVAAPLAMAEGSGFYGALDVGQSKVNNACEGIPAGVSCKNTDTDYRLSVGYQVNPSFGVEGSYVDSGKITASGLGITVDTKNTEWQLAAIGTLPVANGFSIIGKAGLAFWNIKTSATPFTPPGFSPTGNDFLWGIGAQYDITKAVAVRGQYDSHMIGDKVTGRDHLTTLNIGVVYKF